MKRLLSSRLWQQETLKFWDYAVLILLGFFLFMFGNEQFTLFDNSEPHYARVAQELVQTSDKLTLSFNGAPWYVHPPLYFWMTWASTSLLGWADWVLRIWEGLFGILGLLVVYQMGTTFFNRRTGLVAAVILGSSLYYMVLSRLAIFDTILNTFMLFSIYAFLVGVYRHEARGRWFAFAGIGMGLAILTKGPIGLIQPGVPALIFLAITGQLKVLKDWRFWGAIGMGLAIGAPWYAYECITEGWPFFEVALKDYTWYRFFGAVEGQRGAWYFYFPVLLGFFPWIMYLPSTVLQALRQKIWRPYTTHDAVMLFSWIFILFSFLFFSLAQTKLPNYIIGIFPFLSLMIAHTLLHVHEKPLLGWTSIIFPVSMSAAFVASTLIILPAPYHGAQPIVVGLFAILSLGGWFYAAAFLRHRLSAIGVGVTTMVVVAFYLTHVVLPAYEPFKEPITLIHAIQDTGRPYVLVAVNAFSPSMKFYLNRSIPDVASVAEGLKLVREAQPGEARLLVLNRSELQALEHQTTHVRIISQTWTKIVVEVE